MNRKELEGQLIDCIVDGMDTRDLMQVVTEVLYDNYSGYTDEQLKAEIAEYYPHLLEG